MYRKNSWTLPFVQARVPPSLTMRPGSRTSRRSEDNVPEATGGWSFPDERIGSGWGARVVVSPRQVRDFSKATGQRAKTDAIDAQVLVRFAEVIRPEPRPLPDEPTQALAALVTRRPQLIERLTAEKNRRTSARPAIRTNLRAHIA